MSPVTPRLGMLTTSWPTERTPYAGHFVASAAQAFAKAGYEVGVAAPAFADEGKMLRPPGVELVTTSVRGRAGGLVHSPSRWLRVLASLRGAARDATYPVWLAHWWPTALAIPSTAAGLIVLHGSDVDLLERLPTLAARPLARFLSQHQVTAVAAHLALRFNGILGRCHATVTPLGVSAPATQTEVRPAELNPAQQRWWDGQGPRVLTVARDAPGKGLGVARAACAKLPKVQWLIVDGHPPVAPEVVWRLLQRADLVVVPSQQGPGLPNEGCPYIIRQALACGTPIAGGPNHAVRQALEAAGQVAITAAGPTALADAVSTALRGDHLDELTRRAVREGLRVRWEAVLPRWESVLRKTTKPAEPMDSPVTHVSEQDSQRK